MICIILKQKPTIGLFHNETGLDNKKDTAYIYWIDDLSGYKENLVVRIKSN